MALGYWSRDTGEFIFKKKFINRKPADGIPAEVKEYLQSMKAYYDNDWEEFEYVCAFDDDHNEHIYGEFIGDDYSVTC